MECYALLKMTVCLLVRKVDQQCFMGKNRLQNNVNNTINFYQKKICKVYYRHKNVNILVISRLMRLQVILIFWAYSVCCSQNYVFSTVYYLCNKVKLINQIIMLYTLNLHRDTSIIAQQNRKKKKNKNLDLSINSTNIHWAHNTNQVIFVQRKNCCRNIKFDWNFSHYLKIFFFNL